MCTEQKVGRAAMAALLLFVCAGSAQAALVNFTLQGTVDGSFGSPFGLNVGDTVTASGVFDNAAISSPSHTVYFDQSHLGNALTLFIGSVTLNQTQDDSFSLGGSPQLQFDSVGGLIGFSFSSLPFTSGALSFYVEDPNINAATGSWNASSFNITPAAPVPVPAALWLFGSGVLGLAGFARGWKRVTAE